MNQSRSQEGQAHAHPGPENLRKTSLVANSSQAGHELTRHIHLPYLGSEEEREGRADFQRLTCVDLFSDGV